jgi:hypothetical protein
MLVSDLDAAGAADDVPLATKAAFVTSAGLTPNHKS